MLYPLSYEGGYRSLREGANRLSTARSAGAPSSMPAFLADTRDTLVSVCSSDDLPRRSN